MLKINKKLFLLILFIPFSLYANCPKPSEVMYSCIKIFGKKHCNWGAPWYEGFTLPEASINDTANSFVRVFWGSKTKSPVPGDVGSTVCIYLSPTGKLIRLSQNRWGGV